MPAQPPSSQAHGNEPIFVTVVLSFPSVEDCPRIGRDTFAQFGGTVRALRFDDAIEQADVLEAALENAKNALRVYGDDAIYSRGAIARIAIREIENVLLRTNPRSHAAKEEGK